MSNEMNPNDELLTDVEAAKFLKVAVGTIRRWRLEERGPKYTKVVGNVRYLKSDLIAHLHENTVHPKR